MRRSSSGKRIHHQKISNGMTMGIRRIGLIPHESSEFIVDLVRHVLDNVAVAQAHLENVRDVGVVGIEEITQVLHECQGRDSDISQTKVVVGGDARSRFQTSNGLSEEGDMCKVSVLFTLPQEIMQVVHVIARHIVAQNERAEVVVLLEQHFGEGIGGESNCVALSHWVVSVLASEILEAVDEIPPVVIDIGVVVVVVVVVAFVLGIGLVDQFFGIFVVIRLLFIVVVALVVATLEDEVAHAVVQITQIQEPGGQASLRVGQSGNSCMEGEFFGPRLLELFDGDGGTEISFRSSAHWIADTNRGGRGRQGGSISVGR